MNKRFEQPGHEARSAPQKARCISSSGARGRFFFSAMTCCLQRQILDQECFAGTKEGSKGVDTSMATKWALSVRRSQAARRGVRRRSVPKHNLLYSLADE